MCNVQGSEILNEIPTMCKTMCWVPEEQQKNSKNKKKTIILKVTRIVESF